MKNMKSRSQELHSEFILEKCVRGPLYFKLQANLLVCKRIFEKRFKICEHILYSSVIHETALANNAPWPLSSVTHSAIGQTFDICINPIWTQSLSTYTSA